MDDLTGADLVRHVICSLNDGYNGLNLDQRLSIQTREDGTIRYALVDPEGAEQVFTVTVTPDET